MNAVSFKLNKDTKTLASRLYQETERKGKVEREEYWGGGVFLSEKQ